MPSHHLFSCSGFNCYLNVLLYKLLGKQSTWANTPSVFYHGTQVISTLI